MNALQKVEPISTPSMGFDNSQIQLFRELYCKGLTDDETKLFLAVCQRSGLDPTAKQIYPVKRKDWKLGREVMTIQTSIDGYRLIADRTGRYCPGTKESKIEYDAQGKVVSATVYIRKQTIDGTWHEFPSTVYYDEYVQTFKDKASGEQKPSNFWENMPRNQLKKCAEALGLRQAFPQELSGIYTREEMGQSENDKSDIIVKPLYTAPIELDHAKELQQLLNECSEQSQKGFGEYIKKSYQTEGVEGLPEKDFEKIKKILTKKRDEHQKMLAEKEMTINIVKEEE